MSTPAADQIIANSLDRLRNRADMLPEQPSEYRDDTETMLRRLAAISQETNNATRLAVERARTQGLSWTEIADTLGVTKQAAQQRYGVPASRERR